MKNIIFYFSLFITSLIFWSCECVPTIDTPKKILPEEAARVAFINAVNDENSIKIESNELMIIDKLYLSEPSVNYEIAASGSIKIISNKDKSTLFYGYFEFANLQHYTVFFHGSSSRIRTLMCSDSTAENKNKSYIRIINLYPDSPVKYLISGGNTGQLTYRAFTSAAEIKYSQISISLITAENNISLERQIDTKPGYIYNCIINSGSAGGIDMKVVKVLM